MPFQLEVELPIHFSNVIQLSLDVFPQLQVMASSDEVAALDFDRKLAAFRDETGPWWNCQGHWWSQLQAQVSRAPLSRAKCDGFRHGKDEHYNK